MRTARSLLALAAAAAGVLVAAPPAVAHVEPGPKAAEAGTRTTIGFVVEHGCDGSPTVRVRFQLPDGVTDPEPEAPDGWTGSVTGQEVTFEGGPLAAAVEGVFGVAMTLPPQPGILYFPFLQTCEQGELAWIAIPEAGGPEPENPAPALLVTDGPPTPEEFAGTAQPVPPPEPAPDTTTPITTVVTTATTPPSATPTAPAPTTTEGATTAAPATTAAATSAGPVTTAAATSAPTGETAPATDDDDGAPVGLIVAGGVVLAALAAGGVLLAQRRRSPPT